MFLGLISLFFKIYSKLLHYMIENNGQCNFLRRHLKCPESLFFLNSIKNYVSISCNNKKVPKNGISSLDAEKLSLNANCLITLHYVLMIYLWRRCIAIVPLKNEIKKQGCVAIWLLIGTLIYIRYKNENMVTRLKIRAHSNVFIGLKYKLCPSTHLPIVPSTKQPIVLFTHLPID